MRTVNCTKLAHKLGVTPGTICKWLKLGYLHATPGPRHSKVFDMEEVRAAVLKHDLKVAGNAFDDLKPVSP